MLSAKIYFTSEPFMARVEGEGRNPILCIPFGYEDRHGCGVGIIFGHDGGLTWTTVLPRDLISIWRATEFLRRFDEIKRDTLCACFYAGMRNVHEPNKRHIALVVKKIGEKTYADIMAMPVPEQIVNAMLDNQSEDLPLDLFPITDEVRAGTIMWRQCFADAGIKHPDEVDANRRVKERLIARFEPHLASFARSRGVARDSAIMECTKNELLKLLAKHTDINYPDRAVVALAAVEAETMSFALALMLGVSEDGPRGKDDSVLATAVNNIRENAFRHAATWLAKATPWWKRLLPWRRREWIFSFDGADFYLRLMHDAYYSFDDAPVSIRSPIAA